MNEERPLRVNVLTNIPTPYNASLYCALVDVGTELTVAYEGPPSSNGRPWKIALQDWEDIHPGLLGGVGTILKRRRDVDAWVLSGSYASAAAVLRRGCLLGVHGVYYWGERFKRHGLRTVLRSVYMRGLAGVLAVGSIAAEDYANVVGGNTVVHTFPYVTAASPFDGGRAGSMERIGFAGGLTVRKGVDILLKSLSLLPMGARPLLEVAGSGPMELELRGMARRLRVPVAWLGELSPSALSEARKRWRFQLVPSRYDGWGMVVSEGLAGGRPVLASTSVGAGQDLIMSGVNGELLPLAPGAWADAISRWLEDDGQLSKRARCAWLVGSAVSSEYAALWLTDVLSEPAVAPRSFVEEHLAIAMKQMRKEGLIDCLARRTES